MVPQKETLHVIMMGFGSMLIYWLEVRGGGKPAVFHYLPLLCLQPNRRATQRAEMPCVFFVDLIIP